MFIKEEYDEYISAIKKVEDLFVTKDDAKFVDEITNNEHSHQRFEKKIFGYIISALNSQQALLARNRALFLAINLGLVGLATKIVYDYSIKKYDPDIAISTGLYVFILSVMGLICSYLWGITTYYRRHKVWFLESLLVCLEQGYVLDSKAGGPIKMINFIDDKVKVDILSDSNSVSRTIVNCEARKTFKFLRLGFVAAFGVGVFCSALKIINLGFILNQPSYIGFIFILVCLSVLIFIIYMMISSLFGL